MAHKIYDNFYLSNEVEDQFNSHLDLQQFCTVDNSLVGTAGMKRKINVYKATAGTENPELDVTDIVYQENEFHDGMRVNIYRHTVNFKQAFSGRVTARRIGG